MKWNGTQGRLYRACEWITRFAALNMIWLLFNLPIIIFIINLLNVKNVTQATFSFIIIGCFIPILFFPATTAMFAVVRKWIMKEEIKTIKMYLIYYKENYVRSLLGGLVIGLFWVAALFYGYNFYQHVGNSFLSVYILSFIVLFVFTLHFFSITVHFNVKFFPSLKHSLLITIGSPLITLGISIISGLLIFLSIKIITFLIPFFIGSLIAYSSFLGFYTHIMKIESKRVNGQKEIYS